jgi:rubrerythrin
MSRIWKSVKDAFTAARFIRKEFKNFGVEEYAAIAKSAKMLEQQNAEILKTTEAEQKAALAETVNFLQTMKSHGLAVGGLSDQTLEKMKSPSAMSFDDLGALAREMERIQAQLKKTESVAPVGKVGSLADRAMKQRMAEFANSSQFSSQQDFFKSVMCACGFVERANNVCPLSQFLNDLKKQADPAAASAKDSDESKKSS